MKPRVALRGLLVALLSLTGCPGAAGQGSGASEETVAIVGAVRVRASGRDLPPSRCDLRSRAAMSRPPDAISGYLRAWFIESSITVSDALLHAIWKPFMTAIAEMPFQSCLSTTCRTR